MMKFVCGVVLWCVANLACAATVLVLGDSLSAGYGIAREKAWPSLLAQKLKAEKYAYQVENASISGDTTAGGRARLAAALEDAEPKIVIIALGANDGLRGLSIHDMRSNLNAMIKTAQAAKAQVVLVGMKLPPNYGAKYAKDFETVFKAVATRNKVPLVPFLLEGVADKPELFQPDGLHPLAEAQPKLLDNVWPVLKPLLKR